MVNINFIKSHADAILPTYGTEEAAGADVYSVETFTMYPGERRLINTGLDCVIPKGWELQVRPRSGIAFKEGITVLNSPGTIDSDYTGTLKILVINHGTSAFKVQKGDRIAQIVAAPVHKARFSFVEDSRETNRGAGGFGSTGS